MATTVYERENCGAYQRVVPVFGNFGVKFLAFLPFPMEIVRKEERALNWLPKPRGFPALYFVT